MDEHEIQKRFDLNDESGLTRREVLRRGAIVGGTLLWVAPAIQSISQKAFAASVGNCAACYCYSYSNHVLAKDIKVELDKGNTDLLANLSQAQCETSCASFDHFAYCQGTTTSGCFVKEHTGERFDWDPDKDGAVADLLKVAIGCT